MAEKAVQLEDAIALALRLSPVDRLKLVERVVSSVENEMSIVRQSDAGATPGKWRAEVVALLDQLDLTDWEQMDIPDVGDWVHQLRRQEAKRLEHYWRSGE